MSALPPQGRRKTRAPRPSNLAHTRILILADIEGSTGCFSYENGKFMGPGWARACREMSRDIRALCRALLDQGAEEITVKDFHRTGFNLIRRMLPRPMKLPQGYSLGPVPGIGHPGEATALILAGLHAPSGAAGFLPHTLTSRLARVEIKRPGGRPHLLTEAELFSHSLAGHGLIPLFFTGGPRACAHAASAIPGMATFSLDKFNSDFHAPAWRRAMGRAAVKALTHPGRSTPFNPSGPFQVRVTFRDGAAAARKKAEAWQLPRRHDQIFLQTETLDQVYDQLVRLAYFSPLSHRLAPVGLPLFNVLSRAGLKLSQAFQ